MKSYLALVTVDLRLAFRQKVVLFFNYLFPLLFFFGFAEWMGSRQGGAISFIVSMVLVLGILGNGLFGAGMRAVQEREMNILRRFKVAPITPTPLLVASMVTGWVIYMPMVLLLLGLAHWRYGMPWPGRPFSLFLMVSLGILSMRSIGLILASVVNSMQESTILIQLFYMPMLLLSGATIPLTVLPHWVQVGAQFMPATYLVTGFQGIFLRGESLGENLGPLAALVVTTLVSTFISRQLFRWDREEKIRPAARLWVVAALAPFLILGAWQVWSRDQMRKTRALERSLRREQSTLIRNVRIFVGDGRVIDSGAVWIRHGRIEAVFERTPTQAADFQAALLDGSGKTLLPGLLDAHVHLGASGGIPGETPGNPGGGPKRALAAYLYCGVTALRSAGDRLEASLELRREVARGEWLGAELFVSGPVFTSPGGSGGLSLGSLPGPLEGSGFPRTLLGRKEAAREAGRLASQGVDSLEADLRGLPGGAAHKTRSGLLRALGLEAFGRHLPLLVETASNEEIQEALGAGAAVIEQGSLQEAIPGETLAAMAARGVFYLPMLSRLEARWALERGGGAELLERSLIEQVVPADLLGRLRARLSSLPRGSGAAARRAFEQARSNLGRAYQAGVPLLAGSGAGSPLVPHGPTVSHELALWVEAGVPPAAALMAATRNAARLLGAGERLGLIAKGYEADLLLVEGNPLEKIETLENVAAVFFKGEPVERASLLEQR